MDTGDSLQAYFEQQNDNEAASIVAAMMALLPSNSSVISWDDDKALEDNSMNVDENVLNNTNSLLTKEVMKKGETQYKKTHTHMILISLYSLKLQL